MTLDAFLSILIGDILLLAITVVSNIKQFKDGKHLSNARRQIRWQQIILLLLVIIAIIISVIFFTSHSRALRKEYDTKMSEGYAELQRHNYSEASSIFSKAFQSAYNSKAKIESAYWEATCDYLEGLTNHDNNRYFLAETKYRQIIFTSEAQSTEYYVDALVGLCRIFYDFRYPSDDTEYQGYIEWLQNNVIFPDPHTLTHGENAQKLSVALMLAEYYSFRSTEHMQNTLQGIDARKALDYYLLTIDLYNTDPVASMNRVGTQIDSLCYISLIDNILNSSISVDASYFVTSISRAKEMCQKLLDPSSKISLTEEQVLMVKKAIAKANCLYSMLSHDDESLIEAYSILQPVLKVALEKGYTEIGWKMSYWILRTNLCSPDDFETIFSILGDYDDKVNYTDNVNKIIDILLSQCSIYEYIAQNYHINDIANAKGVDCVNRLSTYQEQMNAEDLASFQEYSVFFSANHNVGNTGLES